MKLVARGTVEIDEFGKMCRLSHDQGIDFISALSDVVDEIAKGTASADSAAVEHAVGILLAVGVDHRDLEPEIEP